jgi:hypothetical protein
MRFIKRLATHLQSVDFPLPIHAPADWQRIESAEINQGSLWRTSIALPEVPEAHIIVPSLSCLEGAYQYQWIVSRGALSGSGSGSAENLSALAPITPAGSAAHPIFVVAHDAQVALLGKIDCWHTESPLTESRAHVLLWLPNSSSPPRQDLLTITVRPIDLEDIQLPHAEDSISLSMPRAISQMQAEPGIAKRICSPTATAMAVAGNQALEQWPRAVTACLDPHTKAYGKWPLAIYWASQNARIGAIEALADWQAALTVLNNGSPVVCSIRFGKDDLPGAPMQQTGGHLVVLYGLEFEGEHGYALVMDPGAASAAEVARRYPLKAFSDAWLSHRGGAYLFSTPPASGSRPGETA